MRHFFILFLDVCGAAYHLYQLYNLINTSKALVHHSRKPMISSSMNKAEIKHQEHKVGHTGSDS